MADQSERDRNGESESWPSKDKKLSESKDNGEWLRDQTGEDHNLSGSSTYRTLPDQPDSGSSESGSEEDRQSKR